VGPATVLKNNFQGGIEPSGADHFIDGFFGDAEILHSLHMCLLKKESPQNPMTDHEGFRRNNGV
jgi:hypothetical protein